MFNVDWSDDSLLGEMCQLYLDHPAHRQEITFAADRIESGPFPEWGGIQCKQTPLK